ncbi:MAG: sterol desaturase family protein [Alphaproteobacteria bacterium]|nr:sterol desaturase family protein [Alphaproteobacteria bacterium]NCQ66396.1 sterol desaturase family protein [Alphaproteobacteria bacterium]NCT06881.1 sterol desaturase family protein [Alphaproteobacteria bacterium]
MGEVAINTINNILINNELLFRFGSFMFILLLMLGLERLIPCRPNTAKKTTRWIANLGMAALSILIIRLLSVLTLLLMPVAFALFLQDHRQGLFYWLDLGPLAAFFLTLLSLDLVIYGQHVAFHRVPLLWRVHRVHHTDVNLDATGGVRFHPLEILISLLLKLLAIGLLGASASGVIAFEIILNGTALFNHSNIKLPKGLDQFLRFIIVTPDMHRVHHSVFPAETNSNFGFNLPWWDRLFQTYKAQPLKGHLNMDIGLTDFPVEKKLTLPKLLILPFKKRP